VPLPAWATPTPPGFALAASTKSARVLKGESCRTTSTTGCSAIDAIGLKSFSGSNGIFAYRDGLIARFDACPMPMV
jgi:hypothetical protein